MKLHNLPTDLTELVAYKAALLASGATTLQTDAEIKVGSTFTVTSDSDIELSTAVYTTLEAGESYVVTNLNGANDDISDTGENANTDAEDIADGSDVNANLVVGTVMTKI